MNPPDFIVRIPLNPPQPPDKPKPPAHVCPVCWVKWGRYLLSGCCICTGGVRPGSLWYSPGSLFICDNCGNV